MTPSAAAATRDIEPTDSDDVRAAHSKLALLPTAVGIVVTGALIFALLLLTTDRVQQQPEAATGSASGEGTAAAGVALEGDAAEAALVDAWERFRTATFSMSGRLTRQTVLGGEIQSDTSIVQRPPDRIVRQGGGIIGQVDGIVVDCVTTNADELACAEGVAAPPYDEEVAAELDVFADYFAAEPGLYDVVMTDDGCFELTLRRNVEAPTYGSWARICFDEGSGALSNMEVRRPEGVDVTLVENITTDVSDDDFAVIDQVRGGG